MPSPIPALGTGGMASQAVQGTLDKEAFLKLLITQLQHQDPLNPLNSAEFVAQMAQFTIVEQLQNLNQQVVAASFLAQLSASNALAASLIGQNVEANGTAFEASGSGTIPLVYRLPQEAKGVEVEILDQQGQVVRTLLLGDQKAGAHEIAFDGKDEQGNTLPPGQYLYRVTATDPLGKPLLSLITSSGTVQGVSFEGNQTFLLLLDGTKVPLTSVTRVSAPSEET